jgi:hypothetical protein
MYTIRALLASESRRRLLPSVVAQARRGFAAESGAQQQHGKVGLLFIFIDKILFHLTLSVPGKNESLDRERSFM